MTDLKVFVNDKPVVLLTGMTVKHALISAGITVDTGSREKIYDEWGNQIGLTGALAGGMRIYVR